MKSSDPRGSAGGLAQSVALGEGGFRHPVGMEWDVGTPWDQELARG